MESQKTPETEISRESYLSKRETLYRVLNNLWAEGYIDEAVKEAERLKKLDERFGIILMEK